MLCCKLVEGLQTVTTLLSLPASVFLAVKDKVQSMCDKKLDWCIYFNYRVLCASYQANDTAMMQNIVDGLLEAVE